MSDFSNFKITILSDRIFKLKPREGVELAVEDVKEMRGIFLRSSGDRDFAVLLDATDNFTPTEEVRTLLASKEDTQKRFAAAFVTPTLANKIIGNFFIKVKKPASPTKLFNDEATALEWLQEVKIA